MGRPSSFTQEIADRICERIAGGESLVSICLDEDMPARSTAFRWLSQNEAFQDIYARAREAQADALADDIVHIADTPRLGTKTVTKETGVEVTEGDMIEHRRLQVDARKWMAAKLAPRKYGEKIQQQVTGADGGPLQVISTTAAQLLEKLRGES